MKALHVSKAKSGVIKTYQMIVRVQKGTKTSFDYTPHLSDSISTTKIPADTRSDRIIKFDVSIPPTQYHYTQSDLGVRCSSPPSPQKAEARSTCNRNGKTIIPRENFSPLTKKKNPSKTSPPLSKTKQKRISYEQIIHMIMD